MREENTAPGFLRTQALAAAGRSLSTIKRLDEEAWIDLISEVCALPVEYSELVLDLPRLLPPQLETFYRAMRYDWEPSEAVVRAARVSIDTHLFRAHLASEVIALHKMGRIDRLVADVCLLDLDLDSDHSQDSVLISSSLVTSMEIRSGLRQAESGLIVATHT